jgi:ATP-dependent RNA helicase DeaD
MSDPFAALGLGPELVSELTALGYEEPTPIQAAAIPPLLAGRDLLGQAATGTGKTAAFALPLLGRIGKSRAESLRPVALVLVPTRELAVQVAEAFHRYGRGLGISVVPIYGGQEFHRQATALRRGAHVVIATPGRILDHLRRGTVDLGGLKSVVLDEADEMLDMGFAEDLELILEATPESRQAALFSATLPPRIAAIAERHLKDPERILIPRAVEPEGTAPKVRQVAYVVPRAHKITALGRVLDLESPTLAIVFCRTRIEVDELAERLVGRGYRVEALHGGLTQAARDRVMKLARGGLVDLVVATDVAARGLDIEHLSHVVNFDVPSSPEAYVHRIGRTGRAGREGVAITLAEPREHRLVRNIEHFTRRKISIETVPTPFDVKARRLDLTRVAVREAIIAGQADGGLESFRTVVESLAGEHDLMDVAAAAIRLAHELNEGGGGEDDQVHIPAYESRARPGYAADGPPPGSWPGAKPGPKGGGGKRAPGMAPNVPMVRIYIAAGRLAGLRPADLVGAIANEAKINPRGIGDIEIADGFSLVELPAPDVERVIRALRGATLRGRKVTVRRDDGRRRSAPPG